MWYSCVQDFFNKSNEEPTINTNQQVGVTKNIERKDDYFQDDMARDLMILIGKAILIMIIK